MGLAFLIAMLILLLMLGFGPGIGERTKEDYISVISLEAPAPAGQPSESPPAESERAEEQPTPQPQRSEMPQPLPPVAPIPRPVVKNMTAPTREAPTPQPSTQPKIGVRISPGANYGPANVGGGGASGDSERVGTAPNGEPLYAAAWYREPSDAELRGYLSTASGPGWALIACRTAPDYRVEDCVGLDEHPAGSQIMRAVLGAAWQFRVRPPRIGGRLQVGSWVRIRIDYGVRPR